MTRTAAALRRHCPATSSASLRLGDVTSRARRTSWYSRRSLIRVSHRLPPTDQGHAPFGWFAGPLVLPGDDYGPDQGGRIAIELGMTGLPETYVANPEGVLVAHWVGPINDDELADLIHQGTSAP